MNESLGHGFEFSTSATHTRTLPLYTSFVTNGHCKRPFCLESNIDVRVTFLYLCGASSKRNCETWPTRASQTRQGESTHKGELIESTDETLEAHELSTSYEPGCAPSFSARDAIFTQNAPWILIHPEQAGVGRRHIYKANSGSSIKSYHNIEALSPRLSL